MAKEKDPTERRTLLTRIKGAEIDLDTFDEKTISNVIKRLSEIEKEHPTAQIRYSEDYGNPEFELWETLLEDKQVWLNRKNKYMDGFHEREVKRLRAEVNERQQAEQKKARIEAKEMKEFIRLREKFGEGV